MKKEKISNSEEEQQLNKARRTALLRYMGVLFAVAFALVLISLVVQMRSSRSAISQLNQASTSALQKAENLQTQNRELQSDRQELLTEKAALEGELNRARSDYAGLDVLLESAKTELESSKKSAADTKTQLEFTKVAYDALVFVLSCEQPEGNVTYSQAMQTLENLKEYLSPDALAIYEALLAQ